MGDAVLYTFPKRWSWAEAISIEISTEYEQADDRAKLKAALKVVLDLHSKWCRGEDGGTRADLTDADLTGARLTGARLTGADLTGARLTGADLTDADLTGADLTGADLTGADLTGARLTRARLTGADLTGADLTGTRLTGADLTDARLTGADLTDDHKLVGSRPLMRITPIGSRADELRAWMTSRGIMVSTGPGRPGCFFGTLEEFRAQVDRVHGDSVHGQEYRAAIALIEAHAAAWLPVEGIEETKGEDGVSTEVAA